MTEMVVDSVATQPDVTPPNFYPNLFLNENILNLNKIYKNSIPFNFSIIKNLFDSKFLLKVKEELIKNVNFTEKETDIYKINQTGDLTNLSGLPPSEQALLSTVLSLRDSLYSSEFRQLLQKITNCGPLSGIKTDMSCAEYTKGNYLLNHDDVIGTRRISFILYLVEPNDEMNEESNNGSTSSDGVKGTGTGWNPNWGGALELYPILEPDLVNNPNRPNVPECIPSVIIPPAFNQFTFFAVSPGHSFHSVQEVTVSPEISSTTGEILRGGKGSRLSISGWFHRPVEGEEGYSEEEESKEEGRKGGKSSLEQLYATTLQAPTHYPSTQPLPLPLPLKPISTELTYLKKYLNPSYLTSTTLNLLRNKFIEESQLILSSFLKKSIADELELLIREVDKKLKVELEKFGGEKSIPSFSKIPNFDSGLELSPEWELIGPPHIQRFLSINQNSTTSTSTNKLTNLLKELQTLFNSLPFRTLIASLTSLIPTSHTTSIRRFRPGLDYTLARGELPSSSTNFINLDTGLEETTVTREGGGIKLDIGLNFTPGAKLKKDRLKWDEGDLGGWEIWIVGEDEGGDESTYNTGSGKALEGKSDGGKSIPLVEAETETEKEGDEEESETEESDEEEEEEEDGPLLALPPTFNQLNLVLRDEGVLKFVKYCSAALPSSRWDLTGEWDVDGFEEEDEEEEDAEEE